MRVSGEIKAVFFRTLLLHGASIHGGANTWLVKNFFAKGKGAPHISAIFAKAAGNPLL